MTRTIGSLFSGIGGLELGLERAGVGEVAWQCELDPYCRRVLAAHWPDALRVDDVRYIRHGVVDDTDVLCGGFPCTDLSHAAHGVKREGLNGPASGLWREMLRIIGGLIPQVVIIENVAAAWKEWLPFVRRDLHELGYASVPIRLRAADVGCPMGRARIFVVAVPHYTAQRLLPIHAAVGRASQAIAARNDWGESSPSDHRVVDGVPTQVDMAGANKALGNAVVPQCAEAIGRAVVTSIFQEA